MFTDSKPGRVLTLKNKGFTLIELLAVIVILAIIALITVPIILNMIKTAKKSSVRSSALGYIDAVNYNNDLGSMNTEYGLDYTFYDDGTYQVSELDIKMKGKKPTSGTVEIENKKVVDATLCIEGYKVVYSEKDAEIDGKCSGSETFNKVTVTFDYNDGSGKTTTKKVTVGNKYGTLPQPTKTNYIFSGWSRLPGEYQEVEYIESTGSQYINTGVKLYSGFDHQIIIDFSPTKFYDYNTIYGSTYDADCFEGWIYGNGNLAARFNAVRYYYNDNATVINNRYLLDLKKDGNTLSKTLNNTLLGTNPVNATLNDAKKNGEFLLFLSGTDYGKYKLYGAKLYIDNTLVREFIPCYNTNTLKYGLFDRVNAQFYPNNGTSDDFSAGDYVYINSSSLVEETTNHTLTAIWEEDSN